MNNSILTGHTTDHLFTHSKIGVPLHQEVVSHFLQFKEKASKEGFDLKIISGFRSFERQLTIWEEKLSGKRKIYSHDGNSLLNIKSLSDKEKVESILRWSAWPGTSRHHWGTDFDLYDANSLAKEELQLVPSEYLENGPMIRLTLWINDLIAKKEMPFFRPYQQDRGGVAIEPWHLSYLPLSREISNQYDLSFFVKVVNQSTIPLKTVILENPTLYYNRYFKVVSP